MKIGVIGTGAVGGYYGALLASNGFDVHFLLNTDFEHVRKYGLWVESKNGDINLTSVNAYNNAEDMPLCDLVIIALKTTHNDLLKGMLPEAVKPDGIVVVLQNGLGVEADAAEILPAATVIGGLCFLCSNKTGPGHIRHLDYGSVRIGEHGSEDRPAGITENLKLVSDIFSRAGIPVHMTDNLLLARWEKLVWNMPFNGLSVILGADTRQLMDFTPVLNLIRDIMIEVIQGACHCGIKINERFADQMIAATKQMVAYNPSMKIDFDAARPLEINKIYKRPIHAAETAGFDMRLSRAITAQLEFMDAKNCGPERSG